MTTKDSISWPDLNGPYTDEFGEISPTVYAAAGRIWPKALEFALRSIRDIDRARTLLFKAAAIVTGAMNDDPNHIRTLDGYLFVTFRRLVLQELKVENGHIEIIEGQQVDLFSLSSKSTEQIEDEILIQEIVLKMTPEMRRIFELRVLGYSFEEIAENKGRAANALRKQFSKELKRLIAECNPGPP